MKLRACLPIAVAVALVATPAASSPSGAAPAPQSAMASLDELYSLPRIIGTAPSSFAWSADSSRVAFLWNDEGGNFRDAWMVSTEDGVPVRVTAFPRPQVDSGSQEIESIRRAQRAEQDGGVSAVAWYPDGEALLVTFRGDLYRVVPGSDPEPLGLRGRQAGFSPDGRYLGFLSGGEFQVARVGADGLEDARNVTAMAGSGAGVARYSWAPAGDAVAVIVRSMQSVAKRMIPDYLPEETTAVEVTRAFPGEEPGRTQLWLFDLETAASRQASLGEDESDLLFSVDWSPDGRHLLVDKSDLYIKDRRLLSIDAATGEAVELYREAEPENVMAFWSAAWAADGESVYFTSDRDDYYHLYSLRTAGSVPVPVTAGDWAVESFTVRGDAVFVVANREHPSRRDIYRLSEDGGEPERLSNQAGTHTPTVSPDGRWAAVLFSSDAVPPDLFLNRLDSLGELRVTDSPLAGFEDRKWVTPEYVTFPSHVDGATIHGRLLLPPGYDPDVSYPAIIGSIYSNSLRNQWGGRNAHPTWGFDQVLLERGYVLLNVNMRGSWGLGRDFRRRMQFDYGGIDVEDVYSGVQFLESLGSVDMARVGVWGSSYGGLMTAMSLFKRPGVFAAGVAGAPATNVWHATTGEMRVMGRPQDQPEAYAKASAFTMAAGLEDPLMIVHGMRDRIVLFKDSLVLLEHLMLHGKGHLVDLVPLPNAPHGWDNAELYQTRYAFTKMATFFDRHLRPGGGGE